jgi:hypothetical protein
MDSQSIENRIREVKSKYPDVVCKWQELNTGAFIVIMRGGLSSDHPTEYMNGAVSVLVARELHNQFIEEYLDNPWIRIIIFGFNNIDFN